MTMAKLQKMKGGWFIGDFEPSVLRTRDVEVACKRYTAGESERKHLHKVATEVTLIASGKVIMNGMPFQTGDIIVLEPGEAADFYAVEETITMVVKMPSVKEDKYTV